MHKIDGDQHQDGRFVSEDARYGEGATQITADWLNAVQEELVNAIKGGGQTLQKTDNAQLLAAIKHLVRQWVNESDQEVQGKYSFVEDVAMARNLAVGERVQAQSLHGKKGEALYTADRSMAAVKHTIAQRDGSGDLHAHLFRSSYNEQSSAPNSNADIAFRNNDGSDNAIRFMTKSAMQSWMDIHRSGGIHPYGCAKAWVNFGTRGGSVYINRSYNVSSVTDLGIGNFRINFAKSMINHYACAGMACKDASWSHLHDQLQVDYRCPQGMKTNSVEITTNYNTGSSSKGNDGQDPGLCTVIIFGA